MASDSPNTLAELTPRLRRIAQRLFIENWSLKLLALAITLVLWFLISGRAM